MTTQTDTTRDGGSEVLDGPAVGTPAEALVADHLPLARHLAARYRGRGVDADDLFQVACVGLVAAAQRFDPRRGTAFASFAVPTILGEIRRHFRDNTSSVRIPRPVQELAQRVRTAAEQLQAREQREPSLPEIAAHLDVHLDAVVEAVASRSAHRSDSLDRWLAAEDMGDDDPALSALVDHAELQHVLRGLDARERRIVTRRFRDEWTQSAIAREIGVSQMHVSRLLTRILTTIRERLSTGRPTDG